MQLPIFDKAAFTFLRRLAINNNREWFNDNKTIYKSELEAPMQALLEELSSRLTQLPIPLSGGPKTMFRINRDVRFSNDKSPYKTNVSAVLTPTGTKQHDGGLVYLHLDATGGFAAAGVYKMTPKALAPLRDAMVAEADHFSDVLSSLDDAGLRLDLVNALSSMPRGYTDQADHLHAEYIKGQSFIIRRGFKPADWSCERAGDGIAELARDSMPFLEFVRDAQGA